MSQSLQFERIDEDLCLLVIGPRPPTDRDWAAWIAFIEAGIFKDPRTIVYSEGGGPNAQQRQALAKTFGKYPSAKVAVMVDSLVGRGIVTALGWLYRNFTAFRTDELGDALEYLGRKDSQQRIAQRVSSAREEIRRSRTIAERPSHPPPQFR